MLFWKKKCLERCVRYKEKEVDFSKVLYTNQRIDEEGNSQMNG